MNSEQLNYNNGEAYVEKNNYIRGIIGSLLGVLLGSIIWIILYQFNIIAAIAGFAIAICSIKGYLLFGGRLDKVGIIITILMTIIGVFLAEYISMIVSIHNELGTSISESISCLSFAFTDSEFKLEFFKELGLGYLFTVIGSASYIRKEYAIRN